MTSNQDMAALLEHETFVRSLARSLVGDRALADDLAQDTWVAALRRPPSGDRSQRGWLARVMHNRLRNLRRGDARRTAREAAVARSDVHDRSESLRERLDLQHRVVHAVLALPTNYRSVMLLHFFDGLSAAEIARRRGVPAATVRSQLKRSIDEVRAHLDRDQPGGRGAWCALLLALEHDVPSPTWPTGITWGAAVIVIGAVALGSFGVFGLFDRDEAPTLSTDALVTPISDSGEKSPRSIRARMPDGVSRVPLPVPLEHVVVECKDEVGRPVSGVEVYVFQGTLRPDGKHWYRQSGPFTTNAAGRVIGPVALTYNGGKYDRLVYARVPGRLIGGARDLRWEASDDRGKSIDVTLVSSRRVRGKMIVPDGFDVTSVRLRVYSFYTARGIPARGGFPRNHSLRGLESVLPKRFECRPRADGTFQFADLPTEGLVYIMAEASGLGQVQFANVGKGKKRIPDVVELTMWHEGVVEGVVLGLSDKSVTEVRVSVRPGGSGVPVKLPFVTTTDARGKFAISGLPAQEFEVYLEAQDPELVFRPRSGIKIRRGQVTKLELRLERGVRVAGRVVDARTGTGIAGVGVTAIEPREFGHRLRLGSSLTQKDGAFALRLPVGRVAIYFSNKPSAYAYPEPQVLKTFVIGDDCALVEGLRFSLERIRVK